MLDHTELYDAWRQHLPARILESPDLAETALTQVLRLLPSVLPLLPTNTNPRQYHITAVKGFDNNSTMLLPALVVRYPDENCPFVDQMTDLEQLGDYLNKIAGINHIFLICKTADKDANNCWHYFLRNGQKHLEVVKFNNLH